MTLKPFPRSVEQLTPEWLTEALRQRYPEILVNKCEIVEIIYGTSTKVRMKLSYDNHPKSEEPPEALCIKGGFDDRLRAFEFMPALYELEANFYRELAPKLDVPMISSYFAESETDQGIIILEDLIAKGARFPRPVTPWVPEMVEAGLSLLAGLHAQTWGALPENYPWLFKAGDELRSITAGCLTDDVWNAMVARPDAAVIPEAQLDRGRIRRALEATASFMEQGPHCVVHFDATINNTYLDPVTEEPRFCDWQCAAIGPFMIDVPYHIAGALTVEDRRKHEKDLFAYYLECLRKKGGPAYSVEEKWLDYRRFEMGMGWLWCTCSLLMQPADTVAAMTERHSAAVADHDTFGALGV